MANLSLNSEKTDPRIIRTRRDLVQALESLLLAKPFSQITVQEITEAALINRATFYAHFEDKYALLDYIVQLAIQQNLDSKVQDYTHLTPATLHKLMLVTCEFLAEFQDRCGPHHEDNVLPITNQIQSRIVDILRSWDIPADITVDDHDTLAIMLSWAIFGPALQWAQGSREKSAEALTTEVVGLLAKAL